MKKVVGIFTLLILVIICGACLHEPATYERGSSISVRIQEGSALLRSSILPGSESSPLESDISHYAISLYSSETSSVNTEGNYYVRSGYLPKKAAESSAFIADGVPSGKYWVVKVEAYAETTGKATGISVTEDNASSYDFVKVAEAFSSPVLVYGNNTQITVSITELGKTHYDESTGQISGDDYRGGDIYVSIILPPGITSENGYFEWSIFSALGANESLISSDSVSKIQNVNQGGFSFQIPKALHGLDQGVYFLSVTVQDDNTNNPDIRRTGVSLLRLLPDKVSSGEIDLNTTEEISSEIEVVDKTITVIPFDSFSVLQNPDGKMIGKISGCDLVNFVSDFGISLFDVNVSWIIDGKLLADEPLSVQSNDDSGTTIAIPSECCISGKHSILLTVSSTEPDIIGVFSDTFEYIGNPGITISPAVSGGNIR